MVVFAAGLFRRLRPSPRDSLAPVVALVGLAGTAVSRSWAPASTPSS
jgi:hypothetical protein